MSALYINIYVQGTELFETVHETEVKAYACAIGKETYLYTVYVDEKGNTNVLKPKVALFNSFKPRGD